LGGFLENWVFNIIRRVGEKSELRGMGSSGCFGI
jgi:hypothetical protein